MKKVKLSILFLSGLLLNACSSIPISTMLTFTGYNERDIVQQSPSDIFIKVDIYNENTVLDLYKTKFHVKADSTKGPLAFNFALDLVKEEIVDKIAHWYGDEPMKRVYILRLTEESVTSFNKMRMHLATDDVIFKALDISIATRSDSKKEMKDTLIDKLVVSTHIKLDKKGGFITLFDKVVIEFKDKDNNKKKAD